MQTSELSCKRPLMSRIESTYCLIILNVWQGCLTFSYYFIFDRIVCVLVTFLPMRALCDAYHKEFESY